MKTKMVLVAIAVVLLTACKKQKSVTACIDGPVTIADGQTGTFTWCGENADKVTWTGGGTSGEGNTFTPSFPYRGEHVIRVRGENKKGGEEASITVKYGKGNKTIAILTNACYSNNTNIQNASDLQFYRAYLYDSKADWLSDVAQGNHNKAKDSASAEYSTIHTTAIVKFNNYEPTRQGRLVSVEYRDPSNTSSYLSNWSNPGYIDLGTGPSYPEYADLITQSRLDNYSMRLVKGRWKLVSGMLNGNPLPIPACNLDDYLKFYVDGTWTYNVGPDNCGGSSQPSNGTFAFENGLICSTGIFKYLTNVSGPFTATGMTFNGPSIEVNFTSGANSGYYIFNYQP